MFTLISLISLNNFLLKNSNLFFSSLPLCFAAFLLCCFAALLQQQLLPTDSSSTATLLRSVKEGSYILLQQSSSLLLFKLEEEASAKERDCFLFEFAAERIHPVSPASRSPAKQEIASSSPRIVLRSAKREAGKVSSSSAKPKKPKKK